MLAMVDKPKIGRQLIPTWSNFAWRDTNAVQILPESFIPGKWDVICHCGRESQEHIGNRRFNLCIKNHLQSYSKSTSRPARSAIITNIVSSIRDAAIAGFVRMDTATGRWYEVGDKMARDKVGQALRDAVNARNKSQFDRKRKRLSLGNPKPPPYSPATSAVPRHTHKKQIMTTIDSHPMYDARPNSIDVQVVLQPALTPKETKIEATARYDSPVVPKSIVVGPKVQGLSNDKDLPPLDRKSMESLKAPPASPVQSTEGFKQESPEGTTTLGTTSSKSPKSCSDWHNQLGLIEWFERDMQDAPL